MICIKEEDGTVIVEITKSGEGMNGSWALIEARMLAVGGEAKIERMERGCRLVLRVQTGNG